MKKTIRLGMLSVLLAALVVCLTFGMALLFRTRSASAAVKNHIDNLEVQAANGEKTTIDYVNPVLGVADGVAFPRGVALFTGGHAAYISSGATKWGVAVLVDIGDDGTFKVNTVHNKSTVPGAKPSFVAIPNLVPTTKQFVLLATDDDWDAYPGMRQFLSGNFTENDTIELHLEGAKTTIADILKETGVEEEYASMKYTVNGLTVEDADGNSNPINWVNPMPGKNIPVGKGIILYTEGNTSYINDKTKTNTVSVVVDVATMTVEKITNKADGTKPGFTEDSQLLADKGKFILTAFASDWSAEGEHELRKFLSWDLNVGEVISLKINGADTTISEIVSATKAQTSLSINGVSFNSSGNASVKAASNTYTLSGKILQRAAGTEYHVWLKQYSEDLDELEAKDEELTVGSDGSFTKELTLVNGSNYAFVYFTEGEDTKKLDKHTITIKWDANAEKNPYIIEGLTVESAPATADTSAKGVTQTIYYVNPDFRTMPDDGYNYIVMFTAGHESFVTEGSRKTNTAILVDANTLEVKKVYNKAPSKGVVPAWSDDTCVTPGEDEFVLLGVDDSYANKGFKKYIAENFNEGDHIKLYLNGEEVTVSHIVELSDELRVAAMEITSTTGAYTSTSNVYTLEGRIKFPAEDVNYTLNVKVYDANGENPTDVTVKLESDFTFCEQISLKAGLNFIEVSFSENGEEKKSSLTTVSAFYKNNATDKKEYVMWVDQFSSAIGSKSRIKSTMKKLSEAGVTAIALEVKGTEGYASYKQTTYSHAPYYTETKNKTGAVSGIDYDTLEEVLKVAKEYNIKVYAAFNFFTEGVINGNDTAQSAETLAKWEEKLYAPDGKGAIKTPTELAKVNSAAYILKYVNPANDEVVEYQLKRVREVLENYDVDGIMMDRARYDNRYSDFSDESREKFEAFLAANYTGKTLTNFPEDIYTIDTDGSMERGPLYYEWYTFRASVMKSFAEKLRQEVDKYNTAHNDDAILAQYVGNSYEDMWQMGLNWANEDFRYSDKLGQSFAGLKSMKNLYTDKYAEQSYLKNLDFIMVGTYSSSAVAVAKYATLANIVTNCEIPVLGSIDLGANKEPAAERSIIQTCVKVTDGVHLFSVSTADMYKVQAAIADREYVKPDVFNFWFEGAGNAQKIEVRNSIRGTDVFSYYDGQYEKMDAGQYSVAVVIGPDGKVVRMFNVDAVNFYDWYSTNVTPFLGTVTAEQKTAFTSKTLTELQGESWFKTWYDALPDSEYKTLLVKGDGKLVGAANGLFKNPTEADLAIPEGGYAITAIGSSLASQSDVRRLLGKLKVGDSFTAVYLSDYVKYLGEEYDADKIDFTFAAGILGSAEGVKITVNGVEATKGELMEGLDDAPLGVYAYTAPLTLKFGANEVKIVASIGNTVIAQTTVTVTSTKPTLERIVPKDNFYSVEAGKTINLEVSLFPVEATETITYESADKSIATVDENGNVKGIKEGRTTITIKAGDKTLTVTVNVTGGEKKGCGSSIGTAAMVGILGATVIALGAALILRKKGKNE